MPSATTARHAHSRILISIYDLVAETGLCRSTIYHEIAAGRLKTVKIGTRRMVRPRDRDTWLDSRVAC